MFGFFFLYSCSFSYLSVRKVLSCSFWSSDSFNSPPKRFNSVVMLLSSSEVTLLLFLDWVCLGFELQCQRTDGGEKRQTAPTIQHGPRMIETTTWACERNLTKNLVWKANDAEEFTGTRPHSLL